MAENISVPPLHQNSENESFEHTQTGFNTLLGVSSIVGGAGRPKGRPLGSKNRPKKPILVTKEADSQLIPINLIIPAGNDIIKSVINYAQRRNTNITVLKGSGPVSNVTLLHHNSRIPVSPIQGTYNMISLSGTWANPNCGSVPPQFITNPSCSSFVICLSGVQGQVYGGNVGGKVMAAGEIIVLATLTNKPLFPGMAPVYRNIKPVEEDGKRYVADQPLPPTDLNVMRWNHSTLADNYYYY